MDPYGIDSRRFKSLASLAGKLNNNFSYHDDIVFLTDNDPTTLYPYYAIKDLVEYNRMHLITIPPMNIEGKARIKGYHELLADMSRLDSVLYYDINEKLNSAGKEKTINALSRV